MSSEVASGNKAPRHEGATMSTENDDENRAVITPQIKSKAANKKNRAKIIAKTKTSLDRRMEVENNVFDELLLVGSVIGTNTGGGKRNELVPVTDCLNWLQDLQRVLRRDEDLYRPICIKLGKLKVVEQKLLPLVLTCRYDTNVVVTVLKILVILTKPIAENTERAGQMVIDTTSVKSDPAIVAQQIKLRENALAQAEQVMEYKRIFTFHSSHHSKPNAKHKSGTNRKGTGLLSIFVSLLAEPLSRSGASRTEADHMKIELVLHLIRNLLQAQPLLNTSSETPRQASQLHHDMISLLERELFFDILIVLCQDMELRENAQYNLVVMEILHHIVKAQDPIAVARSAQSNAQAKNTPSVSKGTNRFGSANRSSTSSALASRLKQEQAQRKNLKTVRHGHFSGTWMRRQADGTRQFVGASSVVQGGARSGTSAQSKGLVQARRKNRLAEPFIGSGKTLLAHTRSEQLAGFVAGPSAKRAERTLHGFCQRFVENCYGPFMKSIKNEFRRDSQRLEEKDKMLFFKLVWFFSQWSRESASNQSSVGRLIITMDVFTFNLVLTATETFFQQKNFYRLAQAVALYSEMMHLLLNMYRSKDKTEHEMAVGLLDRIFYHGNDALDQLPKLLSRWTPGTQTREYLCDLVEVAHISLKLLELNTKKGIEFLQSREEKQVVEKGKISQKIAKMRKDAAEFDVKGYFVRKIVSNQLVSMYSYLLDKYKTNANIVNHRVIAMFIRLIRLEIAIPDVVEEDASINPLGTRRVTLEPMLYNLQLMMVMEQILNDTSIQKDRSYESLISFCTSLMYKFWCAADSNPMLYVECLFQHVMPHRFCDLVSNMYVDDELRMMAERERLREDQIREEMEEREDGHVGVSNRSINDDDDDDEEELEFTGDAITESSSTGNENSEEIETTMDLDVDKSKSSSDARIGSVEEENDDASPKKRKNEDLDDDSSDDEFFDSVKKNEYFPKKRKTVIEDDDSDDENSNEKSVSDKEDDESTGKLMSELSNDKDDDEDIGKVMHESSKADDDETSESMKDKENNSNMGNSISKLPNEKVLSTETSLSESSDEEDEDAANSISGTAVKVNKDEGVDLSQQIGDDENMEDCAHESVEGKDGNDDAGKASPKSTNDKANEQVAEVPILESLSVRADNEHTRNSTT